MMFSMVGIVFILVVSIVIGLAFGIITQTRKK